MSRVGSSTEGGYQSYKRDIDELEKDFQTQNKKLRKKNDEQIKKLEKNQEATLRKKDREAEKVARSMQESMNTSLSQEKNNSKLEAERAKAKTYDRYGKSNGQEANFLKQQLDDSQAAAAATEEKSREHIARVEESTAKKLDQRAKSQNEELEQIARNAKTRIADESEGNKQRLDGQFMAFKAIKEKNFDRLSEQAMNDGQTQTKKAEHAIEEIERDIDHRTRASDIGTSERLERQQKIHDDKLGEMAHRNARAWEDDTRNLRSQVKQLVANEDKLKDEKGQALTAAVKEYEHDWMTKQENIQANAQRELDQQKKIQERAENASSDKSAEVFRETGDRAARLIRGQNADSHKRQQELESAFAADRAQMQVRMKRDKAVSDENHSRQMDAAHQQNSRALASQAKTYQDTLARASEQSDDQIKHLEKTLDTTLNTDDPSVVSPAAENSIRRAVMNKYEETLSAERERNKASTDSIQREYNDRLRSQAADSSSKQMLQAREGTYELRQTQQRFAGALAENQYSKEAALRDKDMAHEREAETAARSTAFELGTQRRKYEDLIHSIQNESRAKLATQKQEAEFESKMMRQSFSVRQNELIRDYDKKLTDQRSEAELALRDSKAKMDAAVRDAERKGNSALDEQARSYEQRIAQLEFQQKEHERVISRNYEDELEKVKRTNALLVSKKS